MAWREDGLQLAVGTGNKAVMTVHLGDLAVEQQDKDGQGKEKGGEGEGEGKVEKEGRDQA
jgi:hypothetical protein